MAKTKSKPKQPVKETKAALPAYDPSKDRRALQKLSARYPSPTAHERAAFDELATDAQRAEDGAKTRAQEVFQDAVRWCVAIDLAFNDSGEAVAKHYAKSRFAYFLDRVRALDAEMTAQSQKRSSQGASREVALDGTSQARKARSALLRKLERFAGKRQAERAAIAAARGTTDSTNRIGESIQALVELGRSWLGRSDPKAKLQAQAAGLDKAALDDASNAAEALTSAATEVTLGGRARATDAPAVNVIEGAVLHEMEAAQAAFDDAHEESPVVSRLIPGPGTRRYFDPNKKAAVTEPTPAPAQAPAAAPKA